MANRYRIVFDAKDEWFVVQIKRPWLPFWYDIELVNYNHSLEAARKRAAKHAAGRRGRQFIEELSVPA